MMATLLLRLSAPMQSWGDQSRFTERDTRREPTKSGVVGLICAALGWSRDHDLSPFMPDKMLMGVRVDREGIVLRDYHITQDVLKASANSKDTVVSNRYYLSDADFLVGLESNNREFLLDINKALQNPKFPLFFGRKAFPPSRPIVPTADELGFDNPTEKSVKDALTEAPYNYCGSNGAPPEKLRLILELSPKDPDYFTLGLVRIDQPISFARREFLQRRVLIDYCKPEIGDD